MLRLQWFRVLRSLGLEFWLLLPVLGLILWFGGGKLTDQILNHVYKTADRLELGPQRGRQSVQTVESITVEMNPAQRSSIVKVKIAGSTLQVLTFQFPLTNPDDIEQAISQELRLPRQRVKQLMVYLNN